MASPAPLAFIEAFMSAIHLHQLRDPRRAANLIFHSAQQVTPLNLVHNSIMARSRLPGAFRQYHVDSLLPAHVRGHVADFRAARPVLRMVLSRLGEPLGMLVPSGE